MSHWRDRVALTGQNTLALPCVAEHYAEPQTEQALLQLLDQASVPVQVLGEGSNVVLGAELPGLVVRPRMSGIRELERDDHSVLVEAGAGVHWDDLVEWAVSRGYCGLENLSWIPGSVGAAPYQNIGAYGVELADRLVSLRAVDMTSGRLETFSRDACQFAYRDSLFKSGQPGRWVITAIWLRLERRFEPELGYGDLAQRFSVLPEQEQNVSGLRRLIIQVRDEKLPDPAARPNAGSFFKNPEVAPEQWRQLCERFPGLVSYPLANGRYKLAAGWLIEQAGWKGRRLGPVGMHDRQALVLVNYGGAEASDVLALQQAVQQAVEEKFGVMLEREPVWLAGGEQG